MYVPTHYAVGNSYQNTSTGFSLPERTSVFDGNDKAPSAYSNSFVSGSSSRKSGGYFDNSTAVTSSVILGNANYLGLESSVESNNGYHISKDAPMAADGFSVQQSTSTMQALVASTKNNSSNRQSLALNSLPSETTYGQITGSGLFRAPGNGGGGIDVEGDGDGIDGENTWNDTPVGGGLGIMLLMAGFYFVTKRRKNMISRA